LTATLTATRRSSKYAIGTLPESRNLTVVQKLLERSTSTTTVKRVDRLAEGSRGVGAAGPSCGRGGPLP
jgi:hypothetical protein